MQSYANILFSTNNLKRIGIVALILLTICVYIHGNSIGGVYQSDKTCKPSTNCCCAVDTITINPGIGLSGTTVSGKLQSGSCQGFNDIDEVFAKFPIIPVQNIDDYTSIFNVPFYNQNYRATLSQDYKTIRVQRTDLGLTGCISVFQRVDGSSDDDSSTPGNNNGNSTTTPGNNNPAQPDVLYIQDLNDNGKFQPLTKPKYTHTSTSPTGKITMDSTHTIEYKIEPDTSSSSSTASASSQKYNIYLTLEPSVSLFNDVVVALWSTIHYVSQTTDDPTTAVEVNPLNRAMTRVDQELQGKKWVFKGITLSSGSGIRYAFSYQLKDGMKYHVETIYYQTSASSTPSSSASTPTPSTPTTPEPTPDPTPTAPPPPPTPVDENTIDPNSKSQRWVGKYTIDQRCVRSDSCCCAQNSLVAELVPGTDNQVRITSELDGTGVCGGMTTVSGDFDLESVDTATYTYPDSPVKLKAILSADLMTIEFTNSIYECKSYAIRDGPAPVFASNSGGSGSGSGSGSSGSNTSTPTPAPSPSPVSSTGPQNNNGGNDFRDSLIGFWDSDDSCKPTTNCCCLEGAMEVLKPSQLQGRSDLVLPENLDVNDPTAIFAVGNLDGGIACFRRQSYSGLCHLENNQGQCTLEGIAFRAFLEGDRVRITNSMYQNCDSVAIKRGVQSSPAMAWTPSSLLTPYGSSIHVPYASFLGVMVHSIAILCMIICLALF